MLLQELVMIEAMQIVVNIRLYACLTTCMPSCAHFVLAHNAEQPSEVADVKQDALQLFQSQGDWGQKKVKSP